MPELPEVETFRRFLDKYIQSQIVREIQVNYASLIKNTNIHNFQKTLKGQKIHKITRRGKFLAFFFEQNILLVHLRMEGRFSISFYSPTKDRNPHCLMYFLLSSGQYLIYEDSRRFGTFHLETMKTYENNQGWKKLGLEPFSNKLTVSYLRKSWAKRKQNIKSVLLEQTVIAGIGNIYACEILFATQISPFRPANSLSNPQLKKIIQATQKILKQAIIYNGTTIHTFAVNDQQGEFTKILKVYGKKGQKCSICEHLISYQKINQRGTFFCSRCQKK